MRRLLSAVSAVVAVVGTLVLIAITVAVSDAVAAPGVARDVVRAIGAQLITLGGSAWQRRRASRKSAQVCGLRHGSLREY
jgi:hypothetical protein